MVFLLPCKCQKVEKEPKYSNKASRIHCFKRQMKDATKKGDSGLDLTLWHRQFIHGVRASHQLILKICLLVHPHGYCLLQSLNPLLSQIVSGPMSWPSYLMDSLFSLLPISYSAFRDWDC